MSLDRIRERFGERVAAIVHVCTDTDVHPKPPWKERKQQYIDSIKNKSDDALLVSLADKVHNACSILLDYKDVGENLWARFRGGRDGTLWYYRQLLEAFKGRCATKRLLRQLEATVSEIEMLASGKATSA
jgi:(p)ppGpp synthase/HD superfamily hydrolase